MPLERELARDRLVLVECRGTFFSTTNFPLEKQKSSPGMSFLKIAQRSAEIRDVPPQTEDLQISCIILLF